MAAAAAIDNLTITGILGCIAGDDTIMAVLQSPEAQSKHVKLRQGFCRIKNTGIKITE